MQDHFAVRHPDMPLVILNGGELYLIGGNALTVSPIVTAPIKQEAHTYIKKRFNLVYLFSAS
jgi:hypothetical protein